MYELNTELLRTVVPNFHKSLDTEGARWQQEREDKDAFFEKYFSRESINSIDKGVIRELIRILWAFNGWTNKDYLLEEAMRSGVHNIRKAFDYLLYGGDSVAKRFDFFRDNVRMFGAACVSEILAHHDHYKYPIWNSRAKVGLFALGVPEADLPRSAQISGRQYEVFCKIVGEVKKGVEVEYPEFEDFFTLDFLLYYISIQESPVIPVSLGYTPEVDFDHDVAVDQVLQLGDGLGFDVEKEFTVTHGCKVDVIWRSRIANLGTIRYAFEVHRRGSRDSAILNLQRVKRDPSIQKVIIVSTPQEIETFQREISSLDEDFRNSVGYFKVSDLETALSNLEALKDILEGLGLMAIESVTV